MSQTPDKITVFYIQEQSSMGAWESVGLGYKDEEKAADHVHRLTAKSLVEHLDEDQFEKLFSDFERPEAGAKFAALDTDEAKIAFLLEQQAEIKQGFLHHGAEEVYGETGGWFSYEDIEITL